jgi:multiple sugar transport system permease protein
MSKVNDIIENGRHRLSREGVSYRGWSISGEGILGWLTILPVIVLYSAVAFIPLLFAVYTSFHEVHLLSPEWEFIGLQNYTEVFQIDRFWSSMWRGAIYMVGSTVVQIAVGIWMAFVLNNISNKFLSAIVFTAYLTPTIIIVLISNFMFDPFVGVLHTTFGQTLGLWEGYIFGNRTWAMPIVVLIGSWKFSVFVTIFLLAQLRSIPDRFYEAAKMAGANKFQMFRYITFPRIKGVLAVIVLLRSIFMFNKYDIIWQLTQGGPGYATTTMPILAYRTVFQENAYGLGNTLAIVMFFFLALGGIVYFITTSPTEDVET